MEILEGRVIAFYKNCPKPSGWFGCRFYLPEKRDVVKLTGIVSPAPKVGVNVVVTAEAMPRDPKYGSGLEYRAVSISPAKDKKSIVSYLCSLRGIGNATAEKVWQAFRSRSIDVIRNDSEKLDGIGISDEAINFLIAGVTSVTVENLLRQKFPELTDGQVKKLVDFYGGGAVNILEKAPYRLCVDLRGERGFGFAAVDAMALANGFAYDCPDRVSAAIEQALTARLRDAGDMLVDLTNYAGFVQGVLSVLNRPGISPVSWDLVVSTILQEAGRLHGRIVIEQRNGSPLLYTRAGLQAEQEAAAAVRSLAGAKPLFDAFTDAKRVNRAIDRFEKKSGICLDKSQREAVIACLGSRISVLTGGPGTGKTATARCLAFCFSELSGEGVVCMAPTHLALRRLKDLVSQHAPVKLHETTAKRFLLGLQDDGTKKGLAALQGKLCLIDESSMLSLRQAAGVLRQCVMSHVVFLGDADQLPSIEPGDFFADLIDSGAIPVSRLTVCHRAAGNLAILRNAERIRTGDMFLETAPGVFHMQALSRSEETATDLVSWYQDRIRAGLRPEDMCILCPSRKHEDGTMALNTLIRDIVNPQRAVSSQVDVDHRTLGMPITGSACWLGEKRPAEFRIGDRVINLENRPGEGRVNGDTGYITSWYVLSNGTPTIGVTFDGSGGEVEIDVADSEELALAYALTVHKSQGQEYRAVAVSLQSVLMYTGDFASRNLLYTAVTRAKESVFLCGNAGAYAQCVQSARRRRDSRFKDRLLDF